MIFNLRSETENENLASELFTLFRRVWNDDFNYELYRALFRLVIKKTSNFDIWNAVFNLIRFISWITSSTSISVSFDDTFITHFFVSQQDNEQTHRLLKARVFEKIKNCTYRNVEDKAWTECIKKIYRVVQDQHVNDKWIDFPDSLMQNAVLKWLFQFQEKFLIDASDVYYTSESSKDFTDAEAWCQLDVFFKSNDKNISKTVHKWKNVEVIDELREFNKEWKAKLL